MVYQMRFFEPFVHQKGSTCTEQRASARRRNTVRCPKGRGAFRRVPGGRSDADFSLGAMPPQTPAPLSPFQLLPSQKSRARAVC